MINERDEFLAYTEQPVYSAANKRDTAYMGRFTFDMLLDFEGLSRVLTIVARGYMWQGEEPDIERAARALRAWCSVPDSKKASPKEDWQYQTQFSDLHGEFPELVDEHGIELDIAIPDGKIITLNGDQNELKRAITNLVVNIYKHNPDGIKAGITVYEENGRAFIKISDSGNEIPEGMIIFEPFVTENASRTAGQGTGLGLAVTKRIVELHGGSITVEKGTNSYTKTFVIRL